MSAKISPIAILRLDADWYASTKVCLDFLFDKVVKGGFVIIDDYLCYEGCRKAVNEFLRARGMAPYLHYVDGHGRYWSKSSHRIDGNPEWAGRRMALRMGEWAGTAPSSSQTRCRRD